MAIDIDLEKNGYKKKGFLGFSYTTYFFYSIVPIFRIDVKGFLIISAVWLLTQGPLYILQYLPIDLENNTKIINFLKSLLDMRIEKLLIIFYIFAISIYSIFSCIWILIGNWYNKHYTKRLLQDGYLPKENDEYSIALLKEYGYLEYTEKEKENIEKMMRAGLDKEEVMQKYEKIQKKVKVFKTKVEKKALKQDITDKEREEYERLITRIETNELGSVKEEEYKKLVLDTFEGNTGNEGNNKEEENQ